jgi:hypothetical protein
LTASPNRLATTSALKPGLSRGYLAGSCSSRPSYALARLLVAILPLRAQAEAERDLELLALRHEVAILRRHARATRLVPDAHAPVDGITPIAASVDAVVVQREQQ